MAARLQAQCRLESMHRTELQEALLAAWRLEQRDAAYIDDVKRLELHGAAPAVPKKQRQPGIKQFFQ